MDGDSQVEFWQNLEKKRIADHDFRNIFVGSEKDKCVSCNCYFVVSVIYPNGTTVVTQMRVGPNTRLMDIKESDGRMLLSVSKKKKFYKRLKTLSSYKGPGLTSVIIKKFVS